MAKKRGPKPKASKDRKNQHLHIALTASEKLRIVAYARSVSKKPTSWARETLLDIISR